MLNLSCDPNHNTHEKRYYADWTAPRPESYREDAELAMNVTGTSSPNDSPAAAVLYRELASGAESGWDYSSRWFADNKTLATIRTTQVRGWRRLGFDLCVWEGGSGCMRAGF